jgi:hypothetical protein
MGAPISLAVPTHGRLPILRHNARMNTMRNTYSTGRWQAGVGAPIVLACLCALPLTATFAQQKQHQELRTVLPYWVAPGQRVMLQVYGQDLKPTEIRFENASLSGTILKTEPYNGTTDDERRRGNRRCDIEAVLPAGLKSGRYPFTLQGPEVEPVRGQLNVDVPAPEIAEQEPNGELSHPQVLPPGSVTVVGKLDGDGVDVFRFDGKAGETWHIEVYAKRNTIPSKFEAVLKLRDSRRTALKGAVDQGEDCYLEVKLPADGAYTVELFDGENRAQADFQYRLAFRKL